MFGIESLQRLTNLNTGKNEGARLVQSHGIFTAGSQNNGPMVEGRIYLDEGSWAPIPPVSGGPPGRPGRPRPADPKDFPTLELCAMPGNAGGGWAGAVVDPPMGPTTSRAAG